MSITKLPSGRWRAQVYDPATGKNVSVSTVLGSHYASFRTKTEAKAAREEARRRLSAPRTAITVAQFRDRWLTDPLFARPKQSTMIRNAELTKAFAQRYGTMALHEVGDEVVSAWLAGGARAHTVMGLSAMWNDAASAKAGRLVDRNPWAKLGLARGPGNRHKPPPSEDQVWELIRHARELSGPFFAAWLQVAAFTGLRPGELDALRWSAVDFSAARIRVSEQFNATTRTFTTPKNGRARDALLTPAARDALVALPRESDFCFVSSRDTHFTTSQRAYHWKAIRAAAGWDGTLYLATRHFAGWYMVNILELPSEDVAIALGHEDGGELVRRLYGHRDRSLALDRVQRAYEGATNVRQLRAVKDGGR